ncbi:MAG: hypothetical protein M0025_02885 [Elusimicrobia bacterium]|nr:hypothetical protein [Elusimicrobiota bacterium]
MKNLIFGIAAFILFFAANSSLSAQEKSSQPVEYTYVMQSEDKSITAKMVNDELDGTGVKVHFFDRAGKLIGRWEISNTSSDSWGLSPKGNYFMCRVVRRSEPGVAGNSEVVVIDKTGKELFLYGMGEIGRWSPNEDYFVVRDYAVRAYDLKGKVLWERKKSPGASEISLGAISNNGRYIVLADSPKTIVLLDQSGKELYTKDFEIIPGKLKFTNIWGIAVDNNGNVLLRPGAASEIRVVDNAGNIKLARQFEGYKKFDVSFSTSSPAAIEIINREDKGQKTLIEWDSKKR